VAKATVCKAAPRNLVRVRKHRKANAGPLPPFFVAGQKWTGEDVLGLSCGPNSVTGREQAGHQSYGLSRISLLQSDPLDEHTSHTARIDVTIASITWRFAVEWFAERIGVSRVLCTALEPPAPSGTSGPMIGAPPRLPTVRKRPDGDILAIAREVVESWIGEGEPEWS
jgi:hypothetical protein